MSVLQASPHGRRVLRHRISAHAVHGAPRIPAQAAGEPVRAAALRLQDPPARLPDPATGGGELQGPHEDDDVQQREEIINDPLEDSLVATKTEACRIKRRLGDGNLSLDGIAS